jgi:putative exosortase-associated protein (TIGR04073 family)
MKNRVGAAALLAGSLLIFGAGSAQGSTEDIGQGMGDKLVRGVVDTFTGIVEWPVQTVKGFKSGASFVKNETASKVTGGLLGFFFRGPAHAIGRTGSGIRELFGFWTANPADNKGVGTPLDAPRAWEDGERYSIFKPTLGEGIKPWGEKLVRGFGNGLGGILEIPSQTVKGSREESKAAGIGKGIVKGFWFFLSREAYGIGDAIGFFVPNHADNPGYAFEEEWPWNGMSSK